MVHLAVILIWQFGRFSSNRQIKITANTVVLSQVLINSNDEQAYPPNYKSVFLPKLRNFMYAKCTTYTVSPRTIMSSLYHAFLIEVGTVHT